MPRVVNLKRGLRINLAGKAAKKDYLLPASTLSAIQLDDYPGIKPKLYVSEGAFVKVGDALCCDKTYPDLKITSPQCGVVKSIVRGKRRKLERIIIESSGEPQYKPFGISRFEELQSEDIVRILCDSGLMCHILQLPYSVCANPYKIPKSIFISALRDKPLSCDFSFEIHGEEEIFQRGLSVLSKIAKVHLGIGPEQEDFLKFNDAEITVYNGKCPAGNVGVQVNATDPVGKKDIVWTIDPTVVLFIGRLFLNGRLDLKRKIALVGSEVKAPAYYAMCIGQPLRNLLEGNVRNIENARIINGNVLTGFKDSQEGYLSVRSSEITVIPEGDQTHEFMGWIMPRFNHFSTSRAYFSWLFKNKEYVLDARIKGGKRNMIMSGEYSKVMPMDIYPEFLIKAILACDIDKMEQLGIYEVAPEDFALAEFVDSSKLELQRIVREGLNMMMKENC